MRLLNAVLILIALVIGLLSGCASLPPRPETEPAACWHPPTGARLACAEVAAARPL